MHYIPVTARDLGHYVLQMQDRIGQLAELLEGVSALELATALDAIHHKQEISKAQEPLGHKNFLNQKYFMPGEDCFIYQRGDTKRKIWYIHIYDTASKKQFIKSLRTTDEVKAITAARLIYSDITGKLARGERIVSITAEELVDKYLEMESRRITDKPKDGITPSRYRVKKQYLQVWLKFIESIDEEKLTPTYGNVIAEYNQLLKNFSNIKLRWENDLTQFKDQENNTTYVEKSMFLNDKNKLAEPANKKDIETTRKLGYIIDPIGIVFTSKIKKNYY